MRADNADTRYPDVVTAGHPKAALRQFVTRKNVIPSLLLVTG
jgi:hypothetical protein